MAKETPRIWLLCGPKAGDNSQMVALATELEAEFGYQVEQKKLNFRFFELLLHIIPRPTLAGLTTESRRTLKPPWPDLVITAGRRNELVARWIQQQSGVTRLVHLGRPWSRLERFDLVVTTPQYELLDALQNQSDESSNILMNSLPLHQVDKVALAEAARQWESQLKDLAHPRIALLIGGNSGAYVFTSELADSLAKTVNRLVLESGGSLLVTSSARTPKRFLERLQQNLVTPGHQFHWNSAGTNNPYKGYLALADGFVVTAESVSMVSEAVATGKPVWLFDIPSANDRAWWRSLSSYGWKPMSHRFTMRIAPRRFRRNIGRIQQHLVSQNLVSWLNEDGAQWRNRLGRQTQAAESQAQAQTQAQAQAQNADLKRTARRVAALLN